MLSHAKPEESDLSLKVHRDYVLYYFRSMDVWNAAFYHSQQFIVSWDCRVQIRLISRAHSSYWEIYNMKLSIDSDVVCMRSDLCRSYHTAIRGLQKKRDNFARNPTKKV